MSIPIPEITLHKHVDPQALGRAAQEASRALAVATTEEKNAALHAIAEAIERQERQATSLPVDELLRDNGGSVVVAHDDMPEARAGGGFDGGLVFGVRQADVREQRAEASFAKVRHVVENAVERGEASCGRQGCEAQPRSLGVVDAASGHGYLVFDARGLEPGFAGAARHRRAALDQALALVR